jgi:hypothetical protein
MFTETQIEILAALDAYFAETPQSVIEADVESVGALKFAGTTAKEYFDGFSQHFNGEILEKPNQTGIKMADLATRG